MLIVRLKALDHVSLKVSDLDKTIDFYQRFGFMLPESERVGARCRSAAVLGYGPQYSDQNGGRRGCCWSHLPHSRSYCVAIKRRTRT
jgi:catechol 2,3-dioxygenase-like lactoylglutathione lyase family enzyme